MAYTSGSTPLHETFKLLGLTVEEIQPAAFGTNPEITIFIFHHLAYKRKTEIVWIVSSQCAIKVIDIGPRIKTVDTPEISSYPNVTLHIFIQAEYRRMAQTIRYIVYLSIAFPLIGNRVIFV